jgi:hypothetical protein
MEEQALYNYSGVTLEIGGVPTRALGIVGTPSLLHLLRARPAHGRLFVDSEATPGNDQSIILSDRLFRELYNGDPAAVGRTLRVSGRELTIVGGATSRLHLLAALTFASGHHWRYRAAALGRGSSQQRMAQHRTLEAWSDDRSGARPVESTRCREPGAHESEAETDPHQHWFLFLQSKPLANIVVRDVQGPLSMLWGASIVVLVIGLGNLGNLAFARSRTRLGELGTRLAIGAARFDVMRQQLVEGLLIGGAGAWRLRSPLASASSPTLRRRELVTNCGESRSISRLWASRSPSASLPG